MLASVGQGFLQRVHHRFAGLVEGLALGKGSRNFRHVCRVAPFLGGLEDDGERLTHAPLMLSSVLGQRRKGAE